MKPMPAKLAMALTVLAAGCLAAGCGNGSIKNALSSPASSKSISVSMPAISPPTISHPTLSPPSVPASPAASESGSSLLSLWIVLAAIVIVAVAVLIGRRSGRRHAAVATWQSKVVDVTANGSALHDALSAAQAPGVQVAGEAGARWADIQRRADDLNTELYALREQAPGEAERLRVADVLAALHAVRSAMDAERAAGAAGPDPRVPGLLQAFEASLRALRTPPAPGDPL